MLSASIMVAPLAAGHGTNDGTRKTQSGTRMAKRQWTDSQLSDAKYLMAGEFQRHINRGWKILNTTKNAVLGALYRDKVRNGYVPPPDSKYTVSKIRHRFKRDPPWVKWNAMYVQRLLLDPVDLTVSAMSARGLDVLYET